MSADAARRAVEDVYCGEYGALLATLIRHGGGDFDWIIYRDSASAVTVDIDDGHATGEGNDTLISVNGVVGSSGSDILKGHAGRNEFRGKDGADVLKGRGGNDTLRGNDGNDTLKGGAGNDELVGGPGTDSCTGGPGKDSKRGCP